MPVDAFNSTLPPEQNVVALAAVSVEAGAALTVTTTGEEVEEQPETERRTV